MDKGHPLLRIADAITGGHVTDLGEAVELYGGMAITANNNNELLQERIAELEFRQEDMGWNRLGGKAGQFDKTTLDNIANMARVYWIKNPLIKRAVYTQTAYVFAQGVDFTATDPAVQEVIDAFINDSKNRVELTSQQALMQKETELQIVANIMFVFFTDPAKGTVRVRSMPFHEITKILYNPEDSKEPWYYQREWQQPKSVGSNEMLSMKALYPDFRYTPNKHPKAINGIEVKENNPIYHVKVNCLSDMDFGISEVYAAIDWSKAYKEFLEDWTSIVKSLSRFAWKATSKSGSKGLDKAKELLNSTITAGNPVDSNLPPASGSVWMSSDNLDMTPMPKTGATISADDGRRLLLMVSAATGIFEHYFGDPSTGNLATAKAMEQPMLLMFKDRQELWRDVFSIILDFVIDQAAIKSGGKLQGNMAFDDYGEQYVDTGKLDRTVTVMFPDILEKDMTERVEAIVNAATLGGNAEAGTIDLKTVTTQLLNALGEDTNIVDILFPDEPRSWAEIDAEKQAKALEIAAGQQSDIDQQATQAAKASSAIGKAEDVADGVKKAKTAEDKAAAAAGEVEESLIAIMDNLAKELRENGIIPA